MENHKIFEEIKNKNLDGVKSLLSSDLSLKKAKSNKEVGIVSYALASGSNEIFDYLVSELTKDEIFNGKYDPVSLAIEYNETDNVNTLLSSGKVTINETTTYLEEAYSLKPINKDIVSLLNNAGLTLFSPSLSYNGGNQFDNIFQNPNKQNIIWEITDEQREALITKATFSHLANNNYADKEIITEVFKRHQTLNEDEKDSYFNVLFQNKNFTVMGEMINWAGFYPGQSATTLMIKTIIDYPQNSQRTQFPSEEKKQNEEEGIQKITKFLIDYTPNFSQYLETTGTPILSDCIQGNNSKLFDLFLSRGADVNEQADNGETPLHIAIRLGSLHFTKTLLEHGASTTATNINLDTPVHLAVSTGNYQIFDLLLEKGSAYLGSQNKQNDTPISLAISLKDRKMISELLWKGADIVKSTIHSEVDHGIYTISTVSGEFENLNPSKEEKTLNNFKELAILGFDLNQRNDKGDSFPHHFIKTNNLNNLKAFLSLNVHPNIKDNNGNNLLMSAHASSDEVFKNILMFSPANNDYLMKNIEGKDIYRLLIEKKRIDRVAQVLQTQLKFKTFNEDTNTAIKNTLHTIVFAGKLDDLKPYFKINVLSGNIQLNGPNDTPLTMVALMGKNIENFKVILDIKPQTMFIPNKNGKNTFDIIEMIKEQDPKFYEEVKSIISEKFPANIFNAINNNETITIKTPQLNIEKDSNQPSIKMKK